MASWCNLRRITHKEPAHSVVTIAYKEMTEVSLAMTRSVYEVIVDEKKVSRK